MGLSQADAARRLNVSRSVVQRLWDQYQSEDSVSRRPVPGRPRATTPAEDRFLALSARRRRTTTVPQLVADHFQASGRRISATTVRNRLHNAGLYARRPVVCVPLNGRQRRNRLCWAREHVSWTQQQWASRTRYHQSNTVERHSYRVGGILVWAGISLGGHTDLHVFHGGTVTGLRYRDEILDPYVRPYAAAIGNDFILMDDNARPHRARIVEEYLEDHGLERMEWPARSPDLNPIEHLWDYLGREVAALNPPPRSLHELKQGLLCVWSSLPIPVSDNLINSMGNRCRQCIQVLPELLQNVPILVHNQTELHQNVPTDYAVIRVHESSALELLVAIHFGVAGERAGLVSSQVKPVEVYCKKSCPVVKRKSKNRLRIFTLRLTGGAHRYHCSRRKQKPTSDVNKTLTDGAQRTSLNQSPGDQSRGFSTADSKSPLAWHSINPLCMRSACDQSTLPIDVQVFHCKARDPHVEAWRVGCPSVVLLVTQLKFQITRSLSVEFVTQHYYKLHTDMLF
ncbi:transposable element Tcb2 transposase [Trichonephila clavipes]|nr:transposable element Tcb2 transposase [Trichonephila clavipes]